MKLNDQQLAAVTYNGEANHILVTAGAGCGKTRTIIGRSVHLSQSGTDSSRLLIMTFTNRAARELKMRLKTEIGASAEPIQAGTFHSFCLRVMKQLPNSFNISGLTIIDGEDQTSLMNRMRKETLSREGAARKGFLKSGKLLSYYSYSRNTCQSAREYLEKETDLDEHTILICSRIFEHYQQAKLERGFLDFDDLLEVFSQALDAKPKLRHAVCTLFDEVLVDEMQDTNPVQFGILRHFTGEGVRLFCVGDPAQSIYRFRGAEFRHVYQFQEFFGESVIIPLSKNYRSYQEILDFANWLLDRSSFDYRNPLEAQRGSCGYIPTIEEFEYVSEEASWIADTILDRYEADTPLSDIMVLYRTGFDAKTLEAELIRREIPYRFIGGMILTKSAHVRDILSLLRVIRNVQDDLAWFRFLQLWPRVGEKSANRIYQAIQEAMKEHVTHEQIAAGIEGVLGENHPASAAYRIVGSRFESPGKCLDAAISHMNGILRDRYDNWVQRSKDFELLRRVAGNYSSTIEFIDDFTLEPLNDTEISSKSTDDAVTLITVHSAKGTEAPICFVAGATQSNYPHFRALGDIDSEEEERRILYVALTRAQNELFVTRSSFHRNAFWVQRSPSAGESYFLESVPDDIAGKHLHGWSPETSPGLGGLEDIF